MPDNIAIYSTLTTLLPAAEIARLAEGAKCSPRKDAAGLTWYDLEWPNLTIKLRHFHHREGDFAEHVRGIVGYTLSLAAGNMAARLWQIYYHVSKVRQGYGLEIDPAIDDDIAPKFITELASAGFGTAFFGGTIDTRRVGVGGSHGTRRADRAAG
jgi:hypothetical protein